VLWNKQTAQIVGEQIGVKPQDVKYSVEKIIEILKIDPELLEIVKVWKLSQISPFPFEWWQILVFDCTGGEDGDEYYFLFDVAKLGGRHPDIAPDVDNIVCLQIDNKPLDANASKELTVKLFFESKDHDYYELQAFLQEGEDY